MHRRAHCPQRKRVIARGLSPAHDYDVTRLRVATKQRTNFIEEPNAFELILPREIQPVRLGAARNNHRPRKELAICMLHREPSSVPHDPRNLHHPDRQVEPREMRSQTFCELRTAEGLWHPRIVLDAVCILRETAGGPRPVEKKRGNTQPLTLNRGGRAGGSGPDDDYLLLSHAFSISSMLMDMARLTMDTIPLTRGPV